MVENWFQLLDEIGNELGWAPSMGDSRPWWKIQRAEAGKIKRVIHKCVKEAPSRAGMYTFENLELTVAYLRQQHRMIKSPCAVVYAVEEALEWRNSESSTSVDEKIDAALLAVADRLDGERRQYWTQRLVRAVGSAREDVVAEWWAAVA